MKKFILTLLFCFIATSSAHLYAQTSGAKADLSKVIAKAKSGNKDAMYEMGLRYIYGIDVDKDLAQGEYFMREAAKKGHAIAKRDLGLLIFQGIFEGSPEEVFKTTKDLAKKDIFACNNLGMYYQLGYGTEVDYKKAAANYKKAADYEIGLAMNNLALLHWEGLGVEQNYSKAFMLLLNASIPRSDGLNMGSVHLANYNLGYAYLNGWGTDKDMKKALAQFEKAAGYSLPQAMFICGMAYYNKGYQEFGLTEAPEDHPKAVNYLKGVMENPGSSQELKAQAAKILAECYRFGRGTKADEDLADYYAGIAQTSSELNYQNIAEFLKPTNISGMKMPPTLQ